MRAGTLREKLDVLQLTTTKDEYGNASQSWKLLMSIRASRDFRDGARVAENFEVVNTHHITLRCHLRTAVKRNMRVVYRGETYVIDSVDANVAKREMRIECELLNE